MNLQNNLTMKRIFYIALMAVMFAGIGTASAHNSFTNDWKQKLMSEKVAFLTVEMGITPEEAQVFWPIYNEVSKKNDEAMQKVFSSYKALEQALNEGKGSKDIQKLLDAYLDALADQKEVNSDAADKYKSVLPVEKVAKLYIGEEKFRRQHIRNLHNKPGERK